MDPRAKRKRRQSDTRKCLQIAEAMLNSTAKDRLFSWEAELNIFELLYLDNPRVIRLEKEALCVQPPGPRAPEKFQTPLHRAVINENLDRVERVMIGYSRSHREGFWRWVSGIHATITAKFNHFFALEDPGNDLKKFKRL